LRGVFSDRKEGKTPRDCQIGPTKRETIKGMERKKGARFRFNLSAEKGSLQTTGIRFHPCKEGGVVPGSGAAECGSLWGGNGGGKGEKGGQKSLTWGIGRKKGLQKECGFYQEKENRGWMGHLKKSNGGKGGDRGEGVGSTDKSASNRGRKEKGTS